MQHDLVEASGCFRNHDDPHITLWRSAVLAAHRAAKAPAAYTPTLSRVSNADKHPSPTAGRPTSLKQRAEEALQRRLTRARKASSSVGGGGGSEDELQVLLKPLQANAEVDVVVIGGGFTGLSAARFLKLRHPQLKIMVVEKDYVGAGASGRNSGFLSTLIGHDLAALEKKLGEHGAAYVAGFMKDAMDHLTGLIESFDMQCDLEATGVLHAAMCDTHVAYARKLATAATDVGFEHDLWSKERCEDALGGCPLLCGAYHEHMGGVMNPHKFIRALLRNVVLPLGISVHEGTTVASMDPGPGKVVCTTQGGHRITAKTAVVATNAYSGPTLGWYGSEYAPLHVYHVVTNALTAQQLAQLAWNGREGVYTLHHIMYCFRLTADNRLLLSTGPYVRYHAGDALHVQSEASYAGLRDALKWLFPEVAPQLRIEYKWEGVIAMTLNDFPTMGRDPKHSNVYRSLGYCGHGVLLANYAGKVIADLYDRDNNSTGPTTSSASTSGKGKQEAGASEDPFVEEVQALHAPDTVYDYDALPWVEKRMFPSRIPTGVLRLIVAKVYLGLYRLLDAHDNITTRDSYYNYVMLFFPLSVILLGFVIQLIF